MNHTAEPETYADGHIGGMWRALEALMGRFPGDIQEREAAPLHALPQTPGRGRWRRRVFDGVVHRAGGWIEAGLRDQIVPS